MTSRSALRCLAPSCGKAIRKGQAILVMSSPTTRVAILMALARERRRAAINTEVTS